MKEVQPSHAANAASYRFPFMKPNRRLYTEFQHTFNSANCLTFRSIAAMLYVNIGKVYVSCNLSWTGSSRLLAWFSIELHAA